MTDNQAKCDSHRSGDMQLLAVYHMGGVVWFVNIVNGNLVVVRNTSPYKTDNVVSDIFGIYLSLVGCDL